MLNKVSFWLKSASILFSFAMIYSSFVQAEPGPLLPKVEETPGPLLP